MLIWISGDANADLDIAMSRTNGCQLRTVESFDLIQSNVTYFVCPLVILIHYHLNSSLFLLLLPCDSLYYCCTCALIVPFAL